MWFSSYFDSRTAQCERSGGRRRPLLRSGARPAADHRRREARRLFLEGLEDRNLMAFNVLADYATGANPYDLALAQINAGSQPDLVAVNIGDSTVSVRLGNGDGTFGAAQVSTTGTSPNSVADGDLTGDNTTDLVTANS